jgi:hypothetical protein
MPAREAGRRNLRRPRPRPRCPWPCLLHCKEALTRLPRRDHLALARSGATGQPRRRRSAFPPGGLMASRSAGGAEPLVGNRIAIAAARCVGQPGRRSLCYRNVLMHAGDKHRVDALPRAASAARRAEHEWRLRGASCVPDDLALDALAPPCCPQQCTHALHPCTPLSSDTSKFIPFIFRSSCSLFHKSSICDRVRAARGLQALGADALIVSNAIRQFAHPLWSTFMLAPGPPAECRSSALHFIASACNFASPVSPLSRGPASATPGRS